MILALLLAVPFDLQPSAVPAELIKSCLVQETLPLGRGTAEKRACGGPRLDAESARKRCRQLARKRALPVGVNRDDCEEEYRRGKFLFPGEIKELVIARRKD